MKIWIPSSVKVLCKLDVVRFYQFYSYDATCMFL